MAIVQNANEEHQFLFAVNTISMVKSDALFSYIAPSNILGWILTPIRHVLPFRTFVKFNRTTVKITHFPILFFIFFYERILLSRLAYEPTDLVEQRGRSAAKVPAFSSGDAQGQIFSPGTRLREPSVATYHKDRALEEVFRRPFRNSMRQPDSGAISERRKSSTMVRDWMHGMDNDGAEAPQEQSRRVLDRLERRPKLPRFNTAQLFPKHHRAPAEIARSVASDPDITPKKRYHPIAEEVEETLEMSMDDQVVHEAEEDGDDELLTHDDDEQATQDNTGTIFSEERRRPSMDQSGDEAADEDEGSQDESISKPMLRRLQSSKDGQPTVAGSSVSPGTHLYPVGPDSTQSQQSPRRRAHNRNSSTNTILFSPLKPLTSLATQQRISASRSSVSTTEQQARSLPKRPKTPRLNTAIHTPSHAYAHGNVARSGARTPKRPNILRTNTDAPVVGSSSKPRPIFPPRDMRQSTPEIGALLGFHLGRTETERVPSFNAQALDLASDLGDNRHGPDYGNAFGAMPASFGTQLESAFLNRRYMRGQQSRKRGSRPFQLSDHGDQDDEDDNSASNSERERNRNRDKIILTRMNLLEQGIREVVKEVKEWRKEGEEFMYSAGASARQSGFPSRTGSQRASLGGLSAGSEGKRPTLGDKSRKREKGKERMKVKTPPSREGGKGNSISEVQRMDEEKKHENKEAFAGTIRDDGVDAQGQEPERVGETDVDKGGSI
jgi:hypothetical protein